MTDSEKDVFKKATGLVNLPAPPAPSTPIPKKNSTGNPRCTSLLSNCVTSVAKSQSKCKFCLGSIAKTHTTENCRNYTLDGRNKHIMKATNEHLARENAKIKRAYQSLGIQDLFDDEVNYALDNMLTWNEIFLATRALEDRGLVNGVHYERVTLPNEGNLHIMY